MAATTVTNLPESTEIMAVDNANPLHQFRSYSYHFFLVACDSTTVLDYLSTSAATAFERSQQHLQNNRDVINVPGYGNYVIVIDTRQDVDIIIENVQWGTTFVGDQNSSHSSVALNVVMTDGIINFVEPRGVNFLNILANLGDQLNVDMICMPFLLKTVFYGHTESGQVVPLNSVTPLGFVPVDIIGTVDERGSTYKMDICGVINGVVHNPSYSAIVDNMSFPITAGQTLAQHLATFTQLINKMYAAQRQLVIQETSTTIDLSNSASVVYNLELEPNSQVLQYLNDFGTNQPDQFLIENGKHIIKGTKEGGIPEVILKLLTSSQHWVQVAAQGDPPDATDVDNTNRRYTFKVTQEFESTSSSVTTKNIVKANIYVSEYRYETVEVISTPAGQTTMQPIPKIDPSQVLNFEYIFTGRNVDIVGMEIDLSMGLALLQTLSTAKAMSSQGQDAKGGQAPLPSTIQAAAAAAGPLNIRGTVRKGTPIFAPLQWASDYLKEMRDIQSTATAEAIWKNFASYQSVNTTLTIAGNPDLLAKIIDPDRSVPNYVKVHIKMPSTPADIWEYQLGSNASPNGYYTDFWFTGYYLIVSAINKFEGGLFTQELDLVSLPQTSPTQGSTAAIDTALANIENARQVFFNTTPTTPSASNTTPTAPVTPGSNSTASKKPATPTTTNPTSSSHQQFVANYWNTALAAYNSTGIDPNFTLAQAAIETTWGTSKQSLSYNSFFNERFFNSTYQSGFISGTNNGTTEPFAAYPNIENSFLDQAGTLNRIYPTSASAGDINTYANGLISGKGGSQWTSTNPSSYPPSIIAAYNEIQTYKTTLGIQNYLVYLNGPAPAGSVSQSNILAVTPPSSTTTSPNSSTTTVYATNRTVSQAATAQKATVFPG